MVNDNLANLRIKIEAKKKELAELRVPRISRRMLHGGLQTRPLRQEIGKFKEHITSQQEHFKAKLKALKEYEEYYKKPKPSNGMNGMNGDLLPLEEQPLIPQVTFFPCPKLRPVRKTKRMGWF